MAKVEIKKLIIRNWPLIIILAIGAFMRLYQISGYMTFLGDEGRDVIIVRRLLVEGHPPLIGPGTSIGNMYLGPLYYYMMAPALLIANFSPVGPAVQIALLGVVTIGMVFYIGKVWFGKKGALLGAFLYAIAPTIIIYNRSSWNPNIMPFFALLTMFSVWKVWHDKAYKWIIVTGISFAFVLQSHYLGLLLAPTIGIFWLLSLIDILKIKKLNENWNLKIVNFSKYTILGIVVFGGLMSPLAIFDYRHGWQNLNAMKKFFSERQTTVSIKPWNAIPGMFPQFEKITTSLVGAKNMLIGQISAVALVGVIAWVFGIYRVKLEKNEKKAYLFLICWLAFGLLGLSLYKQEIYDHYYGFLMPVPFLLIAGATEHLIKHAKIRGTWIALTAVIVLAFYNFSNSPLKYAPNNQLQRSVHVSQKIIDEANDQKFNFAVIAERNYEGAYRYFLNVKKSGVTDIDPQNTKDTITDTLFVVCEMEEKKCDPTHNGKTEIANFGWSKISYVWKLDGVILYKLVHNPPPINNQK